MPSSLDNPIEHNSHQPYAESISDKTNTDGDRRVTRASMAEIITNSKTKGNNDTHQSSSPSPVITASSTRSGSPKPSDKIDGDSCVEPTLVTGGFASPKVDPTGAYTAASSNMKKRASQALRDRKSSKRRVVEIGDCPASRVDPSNEGPQGDNGHDLADELPQFHSSPTSHGQQKSSAGDGSVVESVEDDGTADILRTRRQRDKSHSGKEIIRGSSRSTRRDTMSRSSMSAGAITEAHPHQGYLEDNDDLVMKYSTPSPHSKAGRNTQTSHQNSRSKCSLTYDTPLSAPPATNRQRNSITPTVLGHRVAYGGRPLTSSSPLAQHSHCISSPYAQRIHNPQTGLPSSIPYDGRHHAPDSASHNPGVEQRRIDDEEEASCDFDSIGRSPETDDYEDDGVPYLPKYYFTHEDYVKYDIAGEDEPTTPGLRPQRERIFSAALEDSRYSGTKTERWQLNAVPKLVSNEQVSDASLLKRRLKLNDGQRTCARAYGANDPENISIVNMKDVDDLTFKEIANALNAKRVDEGKDKYLTDTSCNARYNRTAPIMYAARGEVFVPLSKRSKEWKPGMEMMVERRIVWTDEMDRLLVQYTHEYDQAKWTSIANSMRQSCGGAFTQENVARRYKTL